MQMNILTVHRTEENSTVQRRCITWWSYTNDV